MQPAGAHRSAALVMSTTDQNTSSGFQSLLAFSVRTRHYIPQVILVFGIITPNVSFVVGRIVYSCAEQESHTCLTPPLSS